MEGNYTFKEGGGLKHEPDTKYDEPLQAAEFICRRAEAAAVAWGRRVCESEDRY